MSTAIKIENVSKLYRLGTVGTGTISHDLNRWWHKVRGKEDPYAKVGQVNDRTKHATSGDGPKTSSGFGSSQRPNNKTAAEYVWALRDINLEVEQGEILGIIGRNGAGKSTLLKLLSRVTAPTEGSIKSRGRIASLLEVGTGFHPELTGRENIYLNGSMLGMKRQEISKRLDEIVEFSGCAKYLDTPVKRYSSGMTVRLGFAVAAHLESDILIVDEVLAVGDADFQLKCLDKMESISGSGRTILFVSHQLAAIQSICTNTAIVSKGGIIFRGDTDEALQKYGKLASEWRASQSAERRGRSGSQKATIKDVQILDHNGTETKTLSSGKSATVQFLIDINNSDVVGQSLEIGFGIHTFKTDACLSVDWNTYWGKGVEISRSSKEISVRGNIESLPLQPGDYVIRACAKINGIVADHLADGVADFQVVLDDFYPTTSAGYTDEAPLRIRVDWTNS